MTGIVTSISSPVELTTFVVISTSGVIDDKYCLNAKESLDKNSLSTKLCICDFSDLPSTESIIFFNLVVSSELCSLDIFSLAFISESISFSSPPVSNLKVISLSEFGSLKLNSFLLLGNLEKSYFTGSSVDKSTDCSSPS